MSFAGRNALFPQRRDAFKNMETKLRFSDCTAAMMQDIFGLSQIWTSPLIEQWIQRATDMTITEFEKTALDRLKAGLLKQGDTWNEIELIEYFIGPLLMLVDFNTDYFKIFSERRISARVGEYELYGEPDACVATGTYYPKTPFFCFNEYKRMEDSKGDALGQVLAEMLAAHTLNAEGTPIYGVYVVDKVWYFVVLHDKQYCITEGHYAPHDTDLRGIWNMLNALKLILLDIAKTKVQHAGNSSKV